MNRNGEGRYYDPFCEKRRGDIVLNAVEKGYSPVRGTDYWTAEDVAAIEAQIDEKIDERLDESGVIHIDSEVIEGSLNPPSGGAVHTYVTAYVAQQIEEIPKEVDDVVVQGGQNAVTGNAVYNYVGGSTQQTVDPNGTAPVSGAAVYTFTQQQVNAASAAPVSGAAVAAYAMPLTAIVATDTDPGAGTAVDYADGTVVLVYE